MWPSIRDAFVRFFTDKSYFQSKWDRWVTKVRFALMILGLAVIIPGEFQDGVKMFLSNVMPTKYTPYIGALIAGLGVLLRAGDKTPENVKTAAAAMEQQQSQP